MREHQIVITLKPEQFLEVQRMARVANAKSMGMFVRQRLLAALGIEGAQPVPAKLTAGPDVKRITGELRRLHGELKSFVAESLANSYIGPDGSPSDPAGASAFESGALALGFLPAAAASGPAALTNVEQAMAEFEQARDELEQIAQRAFAISPRLGAMEDFPESEQPPPEEPKPVVDRDPLDELLEDPLISRIDAILTKSRGEEPRDEQDEQQPDSSGEVEEDDVFDVPLPISEKALKKQETPRWTEETPPAPPPAPPPPPPGPLGGPPGGISGGPPPRRRQ